ncbi:MAG: PTS sugar transporter subunit IIA [Victivallales bacterium]|nr:PTS sugar transporter subunit IIA [Victivallales bacterium]
MNRKLLTLEEAAASLKMEPGELRSLAVQGELPSTSRGDALLFFQEDLDFWYSQRVITDTKRHEMRREKTSLDELCPDGCIADALPGTSRSSIVKALVSLAENSGFLYDPADLEAEILRREEMDTTNIGMGVAIPHTLVRDEGYFSDSFLCIARLARPAFFNSAPDGKPTSLLILSCLLDSELHLAVLARIAALCRDTDFIQRIHEAEDPEQMREVLRQCEELLDKKRR